MGLSKESRKGMRRIWLCQSFEVESVFYLGNKARKEFGSSRVSPESRPVSPESPNSLMDKDNLYSSSFLLVLFHFSPNVLSSYFLLYPEYKNA